MEGLWKRWFCRPLCVPGLVFSGVDERNIFFINPDASVLRIWHLWAPNWYLPLVTDESSGSKIWDLLFVSVNKNTLSG